MRVLAVADDLTGALETGAKFAARGFEATVKLWPAPADGSEVAVIDAESRHLSPGEAAQRVGAVARAALAARVELFFHKTDSTLRGNVAAEIGAIAEAFGGRGVEYAPAYPAMGRTVLHGHLFVDGIPAHETEFARDPLNPIRTNDVRAMVGAPASVCIHDGAVEEDVARVAAKILAANPRPAACGPASLAGHLAARMSGRSPAAAMPKHIGSCLIVNGSAHPRSLAQMERAPREWPAVNAADAVDAIRERRPEAVILFGGDTAYAILTALGIETLWPMGEVLPGVALSRIEGGGMPRYAITKAGGFGGPELLEELRRMVA